MKECPRCQHIHFVKNGFVNAKQRYKCPSCHYQFTRKTPRGKPQTHKTLAVFLYCHGISMNAISKPFDSHANNCSQMDTLLCEKTRPETYIFPRIHRSFGA